MTSLHLLAARTGRAGGRRTSRLHAIALATIPGILGAITPHAASAATFEILHQFDGAHGREPYGGVALDPGGAIYGVTVSGGAADKGVVWRLQEHAYTLLHTFRGAPRDGDSGYGNVVLDASGRLVGTTAWGGASNAGTVFTVDAAGQYRVLASYPGGTAGRGLQAGLAAATDGSSFYGAALYGGDASCDCGTVFRIDGTSGAITPLHAFTGADGSYPVAPPLPLAGALHGTTMSGGDTNGGLPFSMTVAGTDYARVNAIGTQFSSGLAADAAGVLWGVWRGGDADNGAIYRIDTAGVFTVAHRFAGAEGYWPTGTLVVGTDGALYGTTTQGGKLGSGTVFRFDPASGAVTTLHNFRGTDGSHPQAGLARDAQGRLVGVTTAGGRNDMGVVFRITP